MPISEMETVVIDHTPQTSPEAPKADSAEVSSADGTQPQGQQENPVKTDSGASPEEPQKTDPPSPESPPKRKKSAEEILEARKLDKERRKHQEQLKAKEKELEELKRFQTNLKTDPFAALREATGLSDEDLINAFIEKQTGKEGPATDKLRSKTLQDEVKELREAHKKALEEQQKRDQEIALNTFFNEINAFVESRPEEFEVIRSYKKEAKELFWNNYTRTVQYANRQLEPEELVALLHKTEEMLTEDLFSTYETLSKTRKFQSRFQTTKAPETIAEVNAKKEPEESNGIKEVKSITNAISTGPTTSTKRVEQMSDEERMEYIKKKYG